MSRFLKSLRRISVAVLATGFVIWLVLFAVVRQPSVRAKRYRTAERSSVSLLRRHVAFLSTTVRPRGADQVENLDRAAAYIRKSFLDAGGRVSEQTFLARGRIYRNVMADFGPQSREVLVLGAHYDAFTSTGNLPGADDNASGTAGLLEVARLLGQHSPSRSIEIVAFTTEEPPFFGSEHMGSAIHAAGLQRSGKMVVGMICLEMIGYFHGEQTWSSPLLASMYPTRGDFIAVTGGWQDRGLAANIKAAIRGAGGITVYSFTGPHEMLDASDQRNYWSRSWNAVMITDTAFLRNPNYHTKRDTPDTLDYDAMARVVNGVFNSLVD